MIHREAYIENRRVLADSGEVTIDVSVRDPITALWVELRAQNGGTYNKASPLAACIDAVELIDGSEVLVSMDGFEAFAVTAYFLGHIPYQLICEEGSLYQNCFLCIPFGRFLGDVSYALDPTRFDNLQIRFKWNLAAVNAVGATGFLTGTGRLTVLADIMEGASAPGAMLTYKEVYTFTTAASGVTYIDLPTDRAHRSLYLRCHEAGVGAFGNLTYIKVSGDQDKVIPFNMARTDFVRWLTTYYPPFHYKHNIVVANGNTAYFLLKQDEVVAYYPSTADTVCTGIVQGMGEEAIALYVAGSGSATNQSIMALVHGWLPFGVAHVPWGNGQEPNSWLAAPSFRSLRLELTQGNADGTVAVVVEQERAY
ncbi:MAG: hypothetical protein PHG61_06895 [Candidatus Marinimicrobia bacterium]|nr:hypothetical protein [Candidatus Neomarinimicrobiota bacterium]